MRRKHFLGALILCSSLLTLDAQAPERCGTDALYEKHLISSPVMEAESERIENQWVQYAALPAYLRSGVTRKIPVVVHIIQSNAQIRISEDRVQSQIQVLNEDFRKLNADTTNIPLDFQAVAADSEIEFCLASIDPNGCATNGINRIISPANANHNSDDEAQLKALIQWDPHKYLNIWVPETMPGLLGYATFPTQLSIFPQWDGVVINGQNFGRGFGTPPSSYALGRTATHEIGHWLGLFHTFQNGCSGTSASNCSSQGDRICDTPPTAAENFGCPSPKNTCTETPVDMQDQLTNYMDYGDDPCLNMYTLGQKVRMDYMLNNIRTQIWSATNLTETGCDGTVSPGCTPTASFSASLTSACTGDSIQFWDNSVGPGTSWQWSFPGGSPSSSTVQNPVIAYNSPGTYDVSLVVMNSFGSDSISTMAYVVSATSSPAPLVEGFEGITNIPFGWSTTDEDGAGTWEWSSAAASEGQNSVYLPNFTLQGTGSSDAIISEPIDFSTLGSAILRYDRAYKRRSAFLVDSFRVDVSTDCGLTWTRVRTLAGTGLISVVGLSTATGYVPASTDWKADTIDLSPFVGNASVKVRFELKSGGGQNIYLDNINMDGIVGRPEEEVFVQSAQLVPNPSFGAAPELVYFRSKPGDIDISVVALDGRILAQARFASQPKGQNRVSISSLGLENLPAGIYLIKMQSAGSIGAIRWMKQD